MMLGHPPIWLKGGNINAEKTSIQAFSLELIEALLVQFPTVFETHYEFKYMLRKKCAKQVTQMLQENYRQNSISFPIVMRLFRLSAVIIENFGGYTRHNLTNITVQYMKSREVWQQALAIEVTHRLVGQVELVRNICLQEQDFTKDDAGERKSRKSGKNREKSKKHEKNSKSNETSDKPEMLANGVIVLPEQQSEPTQPKIFPELIKSIAIVIRDSQIHSQDDEQVSLVVNSGFLQRQAPADLSSDSKSSDSPKKSNNVGSVYLELFERDLPPEVDPSYILSTGIVALLDFLSGLCIIANKELANYNRDLQIILDEKHEKKSTSSKNSELSEKSQSNSSKNLKYSSKTNYQDILAYPVSLKIVEQMFQLSWRHVLQSIGFLLTCANDETINEWVLQCLEKYAYYATSLIKIECEKRGEAEVM